MNERHIFERVIDLCQIHLSSNALNASLARLAGAAGFDHYAYFRAHPNDNFVATNYPLEWQRRYFARSYMTLDPVVTMAKRGTQVFRWSVDDVRPRLCRELRGFYTEAADFGLKTGLSVSVSAGFGRFAILTFTSSSLSRAHGGVAGEISGLGITAAAFLHSRMRNMEHLENNGSPALSARELFCLKWSAEGKSMRETAEILEITYTCVRRNLKRAMDKLGVCKLPQATASATRRLLI
ncbi:autoinducer binding domain-containing protein [Ensifer adhaerens]|uniref:autoinducer binding domain-containing protein n=1 Tax=Ensifer adhaerens TaxID=106592 RepID=UPI00098EC60F|nr:autoinducer binding domain-containing protein [Ensifer adhaerens]